MINRQKILEDLLEYRRTLEEFQCIFVGFSWDAEDELVQLERQHVVAVLKRYIAGEISDKEVETWANLIECRDDIGYEGVADVLHTLANPAITHELTQAVATQLIEELRKPNTPLAPLQETT